MEQQNNIITPQEVVNIAFAANSNFKAESINEHIIHIAEVKYLRPALGAELYANLCNYTELKDMLKPALAFFVKCEIMPSIAINMGNGGLALSNPQYMSTATDKQRTMLYESELSKANTLLNEVVEYIANSGEYPEYRGAQAVVKHRFAGIIL